jgi:hypothetical protein
MKIFRNINKESGMILMYEVVIIFIFSTVMLAVVAYASSQLRLIRSTANREQAFQIAEAGANYYEWRLAHYPMDFQDGTGAAGPYVHDYVDEDTQEIIGQFSLNIIPPAPGSTVVTIESTGSTLANSNQRRTVTVRYGIPSLAEYAFLTNSEAWIGSSESISGPFHTNGGVRFDGTGNAPITSARQTYTCTPTFGCSPSSTKNGIWGSAPQSTKNFWQFPVANVDFSIITMDFADIKSGAQDTGIYLPPSNAQGYSLVFNSDSTVSIYTVTSLQPGQTGWDVDNNAHNESLDYNARTLLFTDPIPASGLIFIEDQVWVEGTVGARALVAAAKLPYDSQTAPSILIPNNIVYTVKDGSIQLGLVAQKDILATYNSPNDFEIDAALIAQNGSVERFYYPGNIKNSITVYGALTSFGIWTWTWVNGSGGVVSGYRTTSTVYDSSLLFSPPPSFPLSSSGYQPITWESD